MKSFMFSPLTTINTVIIIITIIIILTAKSTNSPTAQMPLSTQMRTWRRRCSKPLPLHPSSSLPPLPQAIAGAAPPLWRANPWSRQTCSWPLAACHNPTPSVSHWSSGSNGAGTRTSTWKRRRTRKWEEKRGGERWTGWRRRMAAEAGAERQRARLLSLITELAPSSTEPRHSCHWRTRSADTHRHT